MRFGKCAVPTAREAVGYLATLATYTAKGRDADSAFRLIPARLGKTALAIGRPSRAGAAQRV